MAAKGDADPHVFSVETHFQKMARRPGGVPREKVIESAQAQLDALSPDFDNWLDEKLLELNGTIDEMKDPGSARSNWIDDAHRQCRTLGDVGATMGFDLVSFIANNLCEILEADGLSAEQRRDAIECNVQALLLARREPYRRLRPSDVPELTEGLRRITAAATQSRTRITGTE